MAATKNIELTMPITKAVLGIDPDAKRTTYRKGREAIIRRFEKWAADKGFELIDGTTKVRLIGETARVTARVAVLADQGDD